MRRLLAMMLLLLTASPLASAAVPAFVTYSGRLTDGTGWGESTQVTLTVRIYDQETGGDALFEQVDDVVVSDGYFSLNLQAAAVVFAAQGEAWIGLSVDGGPELAPRQPVGTVPYAGRAAVAAAVAPAAATTSLKQAMGFSDDPAAPGYLSDDAFTSYMRGECPLGWERYDDPTILATGFLCRKWMNPGADGSAGTADDVWDEMVRVGDFWVDRYEASVWSEEGCQGVVRGGDSNNWTSEGTSGNSDVAAGFFPRTGDWTAPLRACSVHGVKPTCWITWFQAQAACALAGKHLITMAEWHTAAQGTEIDGCNTGYEAGPGYDGANLEPTGSLAGGGDGCLSSWGAMDMVGNAWEMTAHWAISGGEPPSWGGDGMPYQPWPDGYEAATFNLAGRSRAVAASVFVDGMPAMALLGGDCWASSYGIGRVQMSLNNGPSVFSATYGFRCALRR